MTSKEYLRFKEHQLSGRYITLDSVLPLIEDQSNDISWDVIGKSVDKDPIVKLEFGSGGIRVMMWSQMHGNESTTTKAIFDLINYYKSHKEHFEHLRFLIIPILNPDGAKAYTRVNAKGVDLNRDAQNKSQPETQALFKAFSEFEPHYCFNLHGQRTIFGVGASDKPATLSFLAPAQDEERSLTKNRLQAMALIGAITKDLDRELNGRIGLYDDSFNMNCTGDTFQSLGVPTLLFEAGHYPDDYEREVTRYFIVKAFLSVFKHISLGINGDDTVYKAIPFNEKSFLDVIIRKIQGKDGDLIDLGIQFNECLKEGQITFIPKVERLDNLDSVHAHREINAGGLPVSFPKNQYPEVDSEIDFVIINNEKILIKP